MEDSNIFSKLEELINGPTVTSSNIKSRKTVADLETPSVSIAILDNGQISARCFSTIHGIDTDTLFQACSISKPIAGLTTIKLASQGKLDLSSRIVDLLPESTLKLIAAESSKARPLLDVITIRHLLSHSAGLNNSGYPGYPADLETIPTPLETLAGQAPTNSLKMEVKSIPGLVFCYSGGGFVILQIVLETIFKKPLAKIVTETLLEPFGMTRSFYNETLSDNETNLAKAYFQGNTPTYVPWHILPEQATAGLWTTPSDLLKVIRAVQQCLSDDTGNDTEKFIPRDLAREMLTEVISDSNMALSFAVDLQAFGHGGYNLPGYKCTVVGFADLPQKASIGTKPMSESRGMVSRDNKNSEGDQADEDSSKTERPPTLPYMSGISVMTNSDSGDTAYFKILRAICYIKGWSSSWYGVAGRTYAVPFTDYTATVAEGWKEWIGKYENGWTIEKSMNDKQVARNNMVGHVAFDLKVAATPPETYKEGNSIDLVLDGIDIMLRLGWKGGKRIVEVWNGLADERKVYSKLE